MSSEPDCGPGPVRRAAIAVEAAVSCTLGLVLALVPARAASLLDLPQPGFDASARVLGAPLVAIGAVLVVELRREAGTTPGPGLAEAGAVGLCGGSAVAA